MIEHHYIKLKSKKNVVNIGCHKYFHESVIKIECGLKLDEMKIMKIKKIVMYIDNYFFLQCKYKQR